MFKMQFLVPLLGMMMLNLGTMEVGYAQTGEEIGTAAETGGSSIRRRNAGRNVPVTGAVAVRGAGGAATLAAAETGESTIRRRNVGRSVPIMGAVTVRGASSAATLNDSFREAQKIACVMMDNVVTLARAAAAAAAGVSNKVTNVAIKAKFFTTRAAIDKAGGVAAEVNAEVMAALNAATKASAAVASASAVAITTVRDAAARIKKVVVAVNAALAAAAEANRVVNDAFGTACNLETVGENGGVSHFLTNAGTDAEIAIRNLESAQDAAKIAYEILVSAENAVEAAARATANDADMALIDLRAKIDDARNAAGDIAEAVVRANAEAVARANTEAESMCYEAVAIENAVSALRAANANRPVDAGEEDCGFIEIFSGVVTAISIIIIAIFESDVLHWQYTMGGKPF